VSFVMLIVYRNLYEKEFSDVNSSATFNMVFFLWLSQIFRLGLNWLSQIFFGQLWLRKYADG